MPDTLSPTDEVGNGDTIEELASEVGVSINTAKDRLKKARKYDSLPADAKAAVDEGKTTVHKAARNDKGPTSATVAEVAEECGVPERTARSRVEQARKYDSLSPQDKAAGVGEHVIKINLARRHLDPIRWGQAFALPLKERRSSYGGNGVSETLKDTSERGNSDTIAEVAAEIGVSPRTAKTRLKQARKYDSLPADAKVAVDEGKTTVHKAAREVKKRAELKEKAKAAATGTPAQPPAWEIRHGDCGKELAKIASGTVDLVFADPPYNIGVDYGGGPAADRLVSFFGTRRLLDTSRLTYNACVPQLTENLCRSRN